MLLRNRIIGSKATTLHTFKFNLNENILSISGGEYWQNGELVFEDVPLFDTETEEPLNNEVGVEIELEIDTYYKIYLIQDGLEMYIADFKENLDSPIQPLILLAYGTLDELFINEVMV